MEYQSDSNTNYNWHIWNNPQRISKETGRCGNQRTSGDHSFLRSVRILRRLWRTCCHSNSSEKPSTNTGVKNSQKSKKREIKKLWNMRVMKIVSDVLGMIPKDLIKRLEELEIRGQAETIQTTALLRSPRILRSVLETWGDLQ